jgi:holo-[acyl-carrier protein] synthase
VILGIGNDILEIERVARMKASVQNRIFTEEERRQAGGHAAMLAGDFACKEAVAKSFGTGFRGFRPEDIEILRDPLGKPYVMLHGGALEKFQSLHGVKIHLAISDTKEIVTAMAVLEGNGSV